MNEVDNLTKGPNLVAEAQSKVSQGDGYKTLDGDKISLANKEGDIGLGKDGKSMVDAVLEECSISKQMTM